MRLFFFRHGIAEAAGSGMDDFHRRLTSRGEARTRAAAETLAALGLRPTRLYSSPLVRARQTADILAERLGVPVTVRDEVGPGFNAGAVAQLIAGHDGAADLLFVGHEPDFSATISALIGGGDITMKKGGLARVDLLTAEPLRGALVWLVAPRLFGQA